MKTQKRNSFFLIIFILSVYGPCWSVVVESEQCHGALHQAGEEQISRRPLSLQTEDVPGALVNLKARDFFDPRHMFLVLLPGNTLAENRHTYHNLAYEGLFKLKRIFRLASSNAEWDEQNKPPEDRRERRSHVTEALLLISDWGKVTAEKQFVLTEALSFRSKVGEAYLRQLEGSPAVLAVLRNIGNYNDSGDYFSTVIQELGVPLENVILIHDELDEPLGHQKLVTGTPNLPGGNKAVDSLQRHLKAYRIIHLLDELWTESEDLNWIPPEARNAFYRELRLRLGSNDGRSQIQPNQRLNVVFKQWSQWLHRYLMETIQDLKESTSSVNSEGSSGSLLDNESQAERKKRRAELLHIQHQMRVIMESLRTQFERDYNQWPELASFAEIKLGIGYESWVMAHGEGELNNEPLHPQLDETQRGTKAHLVLSRIPQTLIESLFNRDYFTNISSLIVQIINDRLNTSSK